jgi:hypothetical protein
MPVEIEDTTSRAMKKTSPATEAFASVAAGVPVPTTIKIEGVVRDAMSVTIGGKHIIYTETLTVLERRALSRAMLPEDSGAPEAYGFNQAAAKVRQIDGEAIGFPANDTMIESILRELGDEAAQFLYDEGIVSFRKKMEAKAKNS